MEDYREIFKREIERLNYLYAKANTKSKKKNMAYDLIFFESMYNGLAGEDKTIFPWTNDPVLMEVCRGVTFDLIRNILQEQQYLIQVFESSFDKYLESEFSVHSDYGKQYHKMNDELLQKYIVDFYRTIDKTLILRFKDKFDNSEIFVNNTMDNFYGLFFPMEAISKNIIFITSNDNMSIWEGRKLVHEMGHDFEIENAKKNGVTNIWSGMVRTLFPEVSSCFFEYAYINYLIENNIYKEDAMMLKRMYLNQLLIYLTDALVIFSHSHMKVDLEFNTRLNSQNNVDYGNELLDSINSFDRRYEIGEAIDFRKTFVYSMGKLLAIYVYDSYKNNPKEFLSNFKTTLLEYKDKGMDAFSHLGITYDSLIEGKVLKKTLDECK